MYYPCLFASKIVYENNSQAVQIIFTHLTKCEDSKLILKSNKLILKSFTDFDG